MGSLPLENSLDDIKVKIRNSYSNPNVRSITQVVLKDGPRAFRIATLLELINPATGEFHHYSLKIDHIDRTKKGWFSKPEKSVRLEGENPDEIGTLYAFLETSQKGKFHGEEGELHLLRGEDYARLENVLEALPNLADTDKLQLVKSLLSQLDGSDSSLEEFVNAFEGSNSETLKHIAAASKLVEYKAALAELVSLVENSDTTEHQLQKHLEENPWMFGSEYSELLPRRTWTRDDRLDYMLRRTVDNFLEIVEIKTAFSGSLFVHDTGRDIHYPSSKLSPVIGQVARYIEEVERNRDQIIAKDHSDPLKLRAKAIVGRDGSEEERLALRNLNAHLSRIEIITFDQLIRIAERVLSIFETEADEALNDTSDFDDDIPF